MDHLQTNLTNVVYKTTRIGVFLSLKRGGLKIFSSGKVISNMFIEVIFGSQELIAFYLTKIYH